MKLIQTRAIYRRLKGHGKMNRKAECICGKKMKPSKRFVSGWACEEELRILKEFEKKRGLK
jgi:hypothetical protein